MKREFTVVVERDAEGWYVASVPELQGCHTQAKSFGELQERIREAIALYLKDKGLSGERQTNMDFFEAVGARYSYRGEYTEEAATRDDLERIVSAGLAAPSGCNKQTTTFVCVVDPELVTKIGEMHTMKAFRSAKAFICCCIDREADAVYEGYSFQVEDCAAAVENVLLAISNLGLASVWVDGWLRHDGHGDAVGALLGVPSEKVVRVILPVGHPVSEGRRPRKLPFNERAWFDRHGG
jgi:predicted RNase H-like HicB family nuclease